MTLDRPYFFCGIGGSGMMPLAMILRAHGAEVAGSDRALDQGRTAPKFDQLRSLGIALSAQDGSGIVSPAQVVVASAAIEASVPDIVAAERLGCARMTRAELLARLFNAARRGIAVGGTSGKSTVTGMIGWILHARGHDPTVMNGAVMTNLARPEAPFASALVGGGDDFVSEVDESDGSIALYHPAIAVLTNVSRDHKPLEELRPLFADFLARSGAAIVNADDAEARALAPAGARSFSIGGAADLVARDVAEAPDGVSFVAMAADGTVPVRLAVPGRHNVSNALAAMLAATVAGVALAEAAAALGTFAGLGRRLGTIGTAGGVTVIDDFAHNPDKIAATLATLHAFPGRLLILFQPHGFGPLRQMRADLARTFAAALGEDDVLLLSDPVYHGGTTDRSVGSAEIVADIAAAGGAARHVPDREDAAAALVRAARDGDRIVVMGARDDSLGTLARGLIARLAAAHAAAPV